MAGVRRHPPTSCTRRESAGAGSGPPLDQHHLGLRDRLGRIQALGAGLGAVHDGVAAEQLERIFELVQAITGGLVAAVDQPAVGLQQHGRAQVAITIPPVAGTTGGTAGAEDALVEAVEPGAVVFRLQALAGGRRRVGLEPGLDAGELGVEMRHVRYQILDHRHVRQRIDFDLTLDLVAALDAGQRVGAVDVHRAGPADAFAAGAAEGQRGVDLVLDLDQRVQNHRATGGHVDVVAVDPRVVATVRVVAIDLEGLHLAGARWRRVVPAGGLADGGVPGEGELGHFDASLGRAARGRRSFVGCRRRARPALRSANQ